MTTGQIDLGDRLNGWWAFAGILIVIAGGFNLIDGIAALAQKEYFNESGLLYSNLQLWGWVSLIIGAVQVLTAVLIFGRSTAGAVLGIVIAVLSAFVAFLAVGAYPVWAIIILVLDALVIYGLTQAPTASPEG